MPVTFVITAMDFVCISNAEESLIMHIRIHSHGPPFSGGMIHYISHIIFLGVGSANYSTQTVYIYLCKQCKKKGKRVSYECFVVLKFLLFVLVFDVHNKSYL